MALVINIETVGQGQADIPPRALDILFRSLRHQEGGEEEIEARKKEMVDRFGLDPTTGRIVCIGLLDAESETKEAYYGTDERVLLTTFWEYLDRTQPDLFITFNGKSFDFPYINIRSAILEISPSVPLPTRRYTTSPPLRRPRGLGWLRPPPQGDSRLLLRNLWYSLTKDGAERISSR